MCIKLMNDNKIAVVLAAYNGENWIVSQILSILNQVNVSVHIFISLDKSDDKTLEIIENYEKKYKDITIINNSHRFGSAAANFLCSFRKIDLSLFSYLALADQDDVWLPNKLFMAIEAMRNSDSTAYSSDLITFDNEKHSSYFLKKNKDQKKYDYIFQGMSAGCTYVLNKKVALLVQEKIIDLPQSYFFSISHDWLIYAICRSHGVKWYHDENSYILYRQHSNNVYGDLSGIKGLIFRLRMSRSGWYREHILKLSEVLLCDKVEINIMNSLSNLDFNSRLWLILNAFKFRRKSRDVMLLIILFLFGSI